MVTGQEHLQKVVERGALPVDAAIVKNADSCRAAPKDNKDQVSGPSVPWSGEVNS